MTGRSFQILLLLAVAAFTASGCSSNQMVEEDLPADAFVDQSDNQGSGSAGDATVQDAFVEEVPVPAPDTLPIEQSPQEAVASAPDLSQSETVASLAEKIEAQPEVREIAAVQSSVDQRSVEKKRRARPRYRSERVEVRTRPFELGGVALNGFYFARAEDRSWGELSQKIYGTAARSEELRGWNLSVELKSGALVYYNSPFRPKDLESMRSFTQDFGAGNEGYSVQRGDTLSRIAAIRYGGAPSWKEIAVENPNLQNPDRIAPGMVIQLPPSKVSTTVALEKLAALSVPVEKKQTEPVPAQAPVETQVAAKVPVMTREPSASGSEGLAEGFASGIRLSPEVLAGAVAVLLLGAFLLRRRAS